MKYDVKIGSLRTDGAIKAYASVNLNDEFAITGIKVMEGSKGTFVSMPNYKAGNGEYRDVAFPITKDAREEFNKAVLDAYELSLSQLQSREQKKEDMPTLSEEHEKMQEAGQTAPKGKGAKADKNVNKADAPEMMM